MKSYFFQKISVAIFVSLCDLDLAVLLNLIGRGVESNGILHFFLLGDADLLRGKSIVKADIFQVSRNKHRSGISAEVMLFSPYQVCNYFFLPGRGVSKG